jgi:hypothetical protein
MLVSFVRHLMLEDDGTETISGVKPFVEAITVVPNKALMATPRYGYLHEANWERTAAHRIIREIADDLTALDTNII